MKCRTLTFRPAPEKQFSSYKESGRKKPLSSYEICIHLISGHVLISIPHHDLRLLHRYRLHSSFEMKLL